MNMNENLKIDDLLNEENLNNILNNGEENS